MANAAVITIKDDEKKQYLNFDQMKQRLEEPERSLHDKEKTRSNTEIFQDLLLRSLKNQKVLKQQLGRTHDVLSKHYERAVSGLQ